LVGSEKLIAELICCEPGQSAPNHSHPRQDEAFYVVEGSGTIIIKAEEIPVKPSGLIFI
jgi:quercetin dioxygenase-like cupin family protein